MAEGLSPMPGGFALEDGAGVTIHPESDGVESCLRDAFDFAINSDAKNGRAQQIQLDKQGSGGIVGAGL